MDASLAEKFLFELLPNDHYNQNVCMELIRLAKREDQSSPYDRNEFFHQIQRARSDEGDRYDRARAARYVAALKEAIEVRTAQRANSKSPQAYNYRIRCLLDALATLDSVQSYHSVVKILVQLESTTVLASGETAHTLGILHNLMLGGALVRHEDLQTLIYPIIDALLPNVVNYYDTVASRNLQSCLVLLCFADNTRLGIAKVRELLLSVDLLGREVIMALGYCNSLAAVELLTELKNGRSSQSISWADWLEAMASLDFDEARYELLSFLDSDVHLGQMDDIVLEQTLISVASANRQFAESVYSRCQPGLSRRCRYLLAAVLSGIRTIEAMSAALKLVEDAAEPPIPDDVFELLRSLSVSEQPVTDQGRQQYNIVPIELNGLRQQLLRMAREKTICDNSAEKLLACLDQWRLEYGKPPAEYWHPDRVSNIPWPVEIK